ncbi:MAG TPA: HAMP domain-containing sensor histidine kinase [Candidatus Saccharimonas sp.]|nr:HAMP domain-containing sensor histidine kinase [Candidatus Saccharimonas sp.]
MRRVWQAVGLGLGLLWLLAPVVAAATAYGVGPYGDGPYNGCDTACVSPSVSPATSPTSTPVESTVVTAPSGLQYAINLHNGQVLPRPHYVVTVTPLNGQGQSFDSVDFYIDGQLVASVKPDADGTARWDWPTDQRPGKHVRVLVRQGADVTTTDFTVSVQAAAATAGTLFGLLTPAVAAQLQRIIAQVPLPVVRGFPYLLFALLGGILLVLVWQAQQEAARNLEQQRLLEHERVITDEKTTLLQLVSHYLRTPLTLLQAGVDSLKFKPELPPDATSRLAVAVETVNLAATGLLKRLDASPLLAAVPPPDAIMPPARVWTQWGFWLPIGLLVVATSSFNFLVMAVGQVDVGTVNMLVQWAVLAGLAVGLYVLLRGRRLRGWQRQMRGQVTEHQRVVDKARSELIAEVAVQMGHSLEGLAKLLPHLAADQPGGKAIHDGYDRYRRLVACCEVAGRLQAGQSEAPLQTVAVSALVGPAKAALQPAADARNVTLDGPPELSLRCRHADWVSQVVASVLDNAVAYSTGPSRVEIAANAGDLRQPASITVRDHGKGIAPDQLSQLFQPFYKAEGALTFNHEGAGLSLYIDRLIMHYVGGEIAIASQLGQGSTVTLTFPIS